MIFVDFFDEYISDLSNIAILESKETGDIMYSEEFIENVDADEGQDVHNLNHLNSRDENLLYLIGLQWDIYVSDNNKRLIKRMK